MNCTCIHVLFGRMGLFTMRDRQVTHTFVSMSVLVSALGRQTSDDVQFVERRSRLEEGVDIETTVDVKRWSPTCGWFQLLPYALERKLFLKFRRHSHEAPLKDL